MKFRAASTLIIGLSLIAPLANSGEIEEIITVVGSRTERSLDQVAATVSVIDAAQIEEEMARDIADLIRFEPGVAVSGTGSRFGLGGFNIRGIEGNRVLTIVDGIRVADEFSFGPFLSARRDYVDVDSLARAEIARGPISSLYGSDALGGVVAFTTKSPRDYLKDNNTHIGVKAGYSSVDSSTVGTFTAAAGNNRTSLLLLYTARRGDETETAGGISGFGPSREEADPQSVDVNNIVAKLSWNIADSHNLTFSIDSYENTTETKVFSDYGTISRGTLVNTRDADDEKQRDRYSINYSYDGDFTLFDRASITVYSQESETTQVTTELRTPPSRINQIRTRESIFDQEINGAIAQADKLFSVGKTSHLLIYGVDYYETDNESLRDGGTVDAAAGNPVFEFFPLPTRDFPPTEVTQLAFFIQDEIELLNGRLLISPGIRYDDFDADATADAIYLSGNPGSPAPVDFDDDEVTAKIGAVYRFNEKYSIYARYSEGFRAPPYDDVNVGFTNFIGGYKTISNPNLVSETSEGWELGLRIQGDLGFVAINAYSNDYDDFIESLAISPQFAPTFGIDPSDGLLTFQSINVDEVEIEGIELSALIDLGAANPSLEGFSFKAAIAYADGENKTNDEPLNSVEPLTAVFGLGYDSPDDRWGANLVWTLVEGKDDSDIDANNPRIATSGYGLLDLFGYYRFNDKTSINIGVFNLSDKDYLRWADTISIGADASRRFTQSGVNASVTLRFEM
jgi:hemoglobin/transferrin/lactoferrin receptor protein